MTRSRSYNVIHGLFGLLAGGALTAAATAAELHVPGDFGTIQAALDAAAGGDEIIVAPGTYAEAINFLGKAVYLHSSDGPAVTIIDATGLNASVVTCASGEDWPTILEGFTITGGGPGDGAGMYNWSSNPTINNCAFTGNRTYLYWGFGGGMYNWDNRSVITNCTFTGNMAGLGGGMYNELGSPTLINCRFNGNLADLGAGMYNESCSEWLFNCTLAGNRAVVTCGGIYNTAGYPGASNCILWGDTPPEIDTDHFYLSACDVQGGYDGCIDADPLFVALGHWDDNGTPENPYDDLWVDGNYHLQPGSPCIDTGTYWSVATWHIVSDADGQCRIMDGNGDGVATVDMGPYEAPGPVMDCNDNGLCDGQEIAAGQAPDCNGNLIPDECDLAAGTSQDTNGDGIPDECQDCNGNGVPDPVDLASGTSLDCNHNALPDECDIVSGNSLDVLPPSGDGIPDECQSDCNGNQIPDDVDIGSGTSQDCNANAVPDECDVAAGSSSDCNTNGVPDECDVMSFIATNITLIADPADHAPYTTFHWPDWSPDGQRTVFEGQTDNYMDLLTITPDGQDFDVLLSDPQGLWWYGIPRYSHDGKWIGMHAWSPVYDNWGLAVCRANGTHFDCWNPPGPSYQSAVVDWSPDDSRLLISGGAIGNGLLYLFDLPTETLTVGPAGQTASFGPQQPDWRIVRGGSEWEDRSLEIIDLQGQLYKHFLELGYYPAWSPDGQRIAYVREGTLRVARADGSGFTNLGIVGRGPRWSPDSQSLVYFTGADTEGRIWRLDLVECTATSNDCNANSLPDECDLAAGTSTDVNSNAVPDECESVGDLNCDRVTDFADINPFVLFLSNYAAWQTEFPGCDPLNGDINGDGTYGQWSFGDINPFVILLTGS